MGFEVKGRKLNTIFLELRLTLPRMAFRPLTISEALLNPWHGPDVEELMITHYELCHEHLDSIMGGYENLCQYMDEEASKPKRWRDNEYNIFDYFDYVDLVKASGRQSMYSFREFAAIRWYIKRQHALFPKYKAIIKFLLLCIIAAFTCWKIFLAPRIPNKEDLPEDKVRIYINIQVGEDIPFDSYTHKGGYRMNNMKTLIKYVNDYYPNTIKKECYRSKDFIYEVEKLNPHKRSGDEIIWDKNFSYITVPVIISKDDWLSGNWRDARTGTPADMNKYEAAYWQYYPA